MFIPSGDGWTLLPHVTNLGLESIQSTGTSSPMAMGMVSPKPLKSVFIQGEQGRPRGQHHMRPKASFLMGMPLSMVGGAFLAARVAS
eukprot:symbB.v1.2.015775.t1/scaffold1181.1/size133410/11